MKKFGLVIILLLLVSLSNAASIGVTPGYIDYGEIRPGESAEIEFYVTTSDIDQEFQLNPEYQKSLRYAMGSNAVIDMRNVSEQNISTWIDFDQESVTIDPTTSETYQLPNGNSVVANGVVSFEVNVPPNAEPGYKMGTVALNPSISGGGSGAGARLIAQTLPAFSLRVSGSVERRLELMGLEAVRVGENQIQIIEQIRNTGTVTTTLTRGEIRIENSQGEQVGKVNLDSATLAPGEYAETDQLWTSDRVEGGQYSVEGQGDYRTGEMYISGNFAVTDTIREKQSIDEPEASQTEESEEAPVILISILTVLLATLLYLLDVRMFWTILLSGGLALCLYIFLGPVSNFLIVIPLISLAIMLYI